MNKTLAKHGHAADGKFLAGNPGRPKGIENKTMLDLRLMRAAIVASWQTVDGPRLLRELATADPATYLKLVTTLLPRMVEVDVRQVEIVIHDDTPSRMEAQRAFAGRLEARAAESGRLGSEDIIDALTDTPIDTDHMFDYMDERTPTDPRDLAGPPAGAGQIPEFCNNEDEG